MKKEEVVIQNQELLNRRCTISETKRLIIDIPEHDSISIPNQAFCGLDNLEELIIKNHLEKVGDGAFSMCQKLKNVVFEKGVEIICSDAFSDTGLNSIYFADDVEIQGTAFFDCGSNGATLTFEVPQHFEQVYRFAMRNGIGYAIKKKNINPSEVKQNTSKNSIWIAAKDFNVDIKGKRLLSDVSVEIGPGEMIMVLGGSGTGKSTFMKCLLGLEPSKNDIIVKCKDQVVKGNPSGTKIQKVLKNKIFYSPQFSLHNEWLTVRQQIQKHALMFRGKSYEEEELIELAKRFSLYDDKEKLLDSYTKHLSGGQKKKLMMACSQTGSFQILVLDEPDSGLDEANAFNLFIKDLYEREVKGKGKSVIVISHHPHNYMSVFQENKRIAFSDIFTRIILLAKKSNADGGTIVFDGAPEEAKAFFGLKNDPYSRLVSKVMEIGEGGESSRDEISEYINKFNQMRGERRKHVPSI